MADETGWMLEKQDKGNNWFLGVVDGTLGWTIDPNKGLRLSRRADAEAIAVLCDDVERISEHLWPDMTVSTPQPETTDSLMEFFIASGCDIDRMTCARLLLRINYGQPLLSEAPLPAQGEPSTASGPTLGTCDTQPAFTHPHAEYCKNWRPVAGQTVEKQVARDYSCTICGIGMPQPCEHVRRTEAALAAQSAQPLSTQDETAEPDTIRGFRLLITDAQNTITDLRAKLAAVEKELEGLKLDIDADDRDWQMIATELGLEIPTREEILKQIRKWKASLETHKP